MLFTSRNPGSKTNLSLQNTFYHHKILMLLLGLVGMDGGGETRGGNGREEGKLELGCKINEKKLNNKKIKSVEPLSTVD